MNGSTQDSNMKSSAGSNTRSVIDGKSPRPDSLGFGLDPQQLPEKVAEKIQKGTNILIALSKDPNVDEISAAIALAIVLDQQKKHVTAIYSGKTPNTLEFLKPEETFEKEASSDKTASAEYITQTYPVESGKVAKIIIPIDSTEDDLYAIRDLLEVVMKRKFKIKVDD